MMASVKTLLFFLQWVLHYAVCREVSVPTGPLYRVAGFSLSLPCSVSGYEGPRMQSFEWYLYRDAAPAIQIGIVSTLDKEFPYAIYQARVRSGEVRVERDSGDKVRLVVQRLRSEDQGKYECYTPTTDARYLGTYSDSVVVKVIPDTLQISFLRSLTGQPMPEGAELTLTCSASIQSEVLTHLSVTFGKRGGPGVRSGASSEVHTYHKEIISIDNLLRVIPGNSYKKRYDDGEITLEKRNGPGGHDVYVMKMKAVQPDDTGSYFCEASQWIRDPDKSWQKIAQRMLDIGNLTVLQLAESLTVTSSPRGEVPLQVGSPLILTCEVLGLPSEVDSGLLVQWMKRGSVSSDGVATGGVEVEVVRMSPDSVVSWGDDPSRASGGSMEKVAFGKYSLKLFSARSADAGVYQCMVSVYAGRRNPGSSTAATLTQRSEGVTVTRKAKEVLVAAVAQLPRGPLLKRGSTVTLICNTNVTTTGPAQPQVKWLWRPIPAPVIKTRQGSPSETSSPNLPVEEKPRLIAAIMHDGVAQVYSNGSEVSIDRLSANSYRLRVHSANLDDQGVYTCQAEAWGMDPNGAWYNTGAKAESNTVTVYLYARAADLLLIPLVVGVSSALFVGIVIIAAVTCCFMKRLAKRRAQK
ncbi:immunoglobulin superfamily member 8 [Thalassophryne amazonica]|uniref:immunoglobulin superfamily member 8 n=1 Tax=Thalassophryne amazonica TaxID=390379 RepID=UPI0014716182|nr:immunoglobulin superfamily member 8 [Thalassophryne amazonica]